MGANRQAVIVGAARTAIGRFQGAFASVPAVTLGAAAISEAVRRSGVEARHIDEVLMGNVLQAGEGQAPARQAALGAGLPSQVGATAINKVCGSGLKAVIFAAQAIAAGDADVVVAGGMENMTQGPYLLPQARSGYRLGDGVLVDATVHDGLWCSFENQHMGNAAEWIAREYGLTRNDLDACAVRSHCRAVAAIKEGRFRAEIVPVSVAQRKGPPTVVDVDECPRADTTAETLSRLKPAFQDDGVVTAGNAPGITDGAAAMVVMASEVAAAWGLTPLARIVSYCHKAIEPGRVFAAPPVAIKDLLTKTGLLVQDIDLVEINEAFAAQVEANARELRLDWDKLNVNGGAIALGHPIGASGARVLVTLLYALQARAMRRGLASLCLGGGEAVAMLIERV
jgi:acetyl-CoA C-acetyltransferase